MCVCVCVCVCVIPSILYNLSIFNFRPRGQDVFSLTTFEAQVARRKGG